MTAHTVGNDENAPIRHHEVVVLIAGSDDANIGAASTGNV